MTPKNLKRLEVSFFMKEITRRRVLTISAKDFAEYDRLYNETSDRLARCEPETKDIDALTTRFYYTETGKIPENLADDFNQHHESPKCADCPFLEVGEDRRRKWFPCPYSTYGQACIDSPACEVFYKEAVRRMREDCEL